MDLVSLLSKFHNLGRIARAVPLGLYGIILLSELALAQTTITLTQPSGSSPSWVINQTPYTPSQTSVQFSGQINNNAELQLPSVSGIYQLSIGSGATNPLQTNSNQPVAVPTSMSLNIAATSNDSGLQYSLTSLGGASSNQPTSQWANNGSNLSLSYGFGTNMLGGYNTGSIINVVSTGGAGLAGNAPDQSGEQFRSSNIPAQSAMSGGSVMVTVSPSSSGATSTLGLADSYQPTYGLTVPWQINSSVIIASSSGGIAGAGAVSRNYDPNSQYTSPYAYFTPYPGNGGSGAEVSVQINSGINIALGNVATTGSTPVVGVSATSLGSPGAVCCTLENYPITVTTAASEFPNWSVEASSQGSAYGSNGSGGAVSIDFKGSITGSAPYLYGLVAVSAGASTQMPIDIGNVVQKGSLDPLNLVPSSGLGGAVTVNLTSANILLSQSNSVGIFAASIADQVIIPASYSVAGSGNTAGAVSVSLDALSSISIGTPGNQTNNGMSAGLVAISSTGWLFQPIGVAQLGVSSAGNGGDVTVTNAGTISVSGSSSFGIVALSLGNGGILSNADQGSSNVNYLLGSSGSATQSNFGGNVTISNSGIITAYGDAAIGIVAASNGSGGLVASIPNSLFSQATVDSKTGILIGTASSGYVAGLKDSTFTAPGGSVSIINTGSINTGQGIAAIGLLAQSVGGGGASFTEGVALFAGDSGGAGGNGGSININNSGSISTSGDGSVGLLAQSIGGGGGHASNSAGLFVALGGQGGSGGGGGTVSAAFQSGLFATTGDFASGVVLQSIGGGGGNGGFGKAAGSFVGVSIGGTGGSGGVGGAVTVESANGVTYSATTSGNQSHGLMLQSIGGGGGMGGHAYSASGGAVFAGAVTVGGSGGIGGNGGAVSICSGSSTSTGCANSSWTISTAGNDAYGVLMQSIGGGGGYGGGAVAEAYSVSAGDIPAISVSIGVGGSGASGTNAGSVSAFGDFTVSTFGTGSHAVFAQSIGGGGGVGADSTAGANSYNASETSVVTSASVGGNGGGGGNGGTINLTIGSSGSLSTAGHNASGIFGQSVGGGGGVAAVGNAATNNTSLGNGQYSVSLALGGNGGSGGAGSAVSINNGAPVKTIGTQSSGLVVQSISGGGGYAGNAGAQGASGTGGNHAVEVVVGGSAGGGAAGGAVTIVNTSTISTGIQLDLASSQINSLQMSQPITVGGDSHGILAQSIGGGGGVGGNADPTAQILGNVKSFLNTAAADWDGLKGNAQFAYGKFKGSPPDPSGDSSDSTSDSGADNDTDPSTDTTADSGGDSGTSSKPAALPINYNASVAVGGKGGAGGAGGAVTVTATGAITTYGPRSYGILAQSIGGGGGIGGSSTSSSAFVSGSASADLTSGITLGLGINVGGAGGDGGSGGVVTINGPTTGNPLFISTSGYASVGILAQSIGGGGGVGHDGSVFSPSGSVGTGVTTSSSYTTPTVNLGSVTNGSAGMSGVGGTVNVGSSASPFQTLLVTLGDDSSGLLAQSIGGGGGLASVGCTNSTNGSYSMSLANYSAGVSPSACYQNANSTSLEGNLVPSAFLGGSTGQGFNVSVMSGINTSAAHGGEVNLYLNSSSTIITNGNRSMGLVAQSIGGGGGYMTAPSYVFQTASLPSGSASTGAGGNITINFANSGAPYNYNPGIYTDGDGSWGLFAQSIGGGGGFLGDPNFAISSVPVANNYNAAASANGPNGGDISITFGSANGAPNCQSCVPTIVTSGSNAHGIFAQSIGGGGGVASAGSVTVGGSSGATPANLGAGGAITIDFYGNMIINGDNSIGIFAQSAGNTSSSGTVSINVFGSISFPDSSGSNAAIMISGGSTNKSSPNSILVNGTISSNSDIYAIWSDYGYTNVINNGYISGSVDLGSTPGEFTNNGQFSAGQIVVVANNSLHNYGVMKIGSEKSVSTTNMKGRLYQHETGKFVVTVDSTNALQANDKIIINGDAIMQGQIVVKAPTLLPGAYPFLSANNVTTSATVKPSHVFTWGLNSSSSTMALTLKPSDADFTPDAYSLTDNQESIADYLQRHWSASNAALAPLFGYLHEFERGDHDAYAAALTQITGQALNSQAIQMKTAFSTSLSDSLSCPKVSSQGLKLNQTSCVWAQVSGDLSEQSSSSSNLGFRSRAGGIRLGAQKALDNQWSTGFGLGYQQNYLTSSGLTSNGQFFDASVSLQKKISAWSFGSSLAFSQGWFKNNRLPQLFGNGVAASLAEQYRSDARMSMVGIRFRGAHEFEQKNYYIKPYVDLDLIYSFISGYTESGGALALRANSSNQLSVAITPMIELGTDLVTDGKRRIKAYVGAGASFLPNNNVSTQMAFANGSNLGTFNVITNGPNVLGRLNLGIQAYESDNFEVRAEYGLQAGGGYWNQQLSVNLAYRF